MQAYIENDLISFAGDLGVSMTLTVDTNIGDELRL